MKVRGTQEAVKPVEVNVDTVYLRTGITRVEEENFSGWEYDEETCSVKDYIERLTNSNESDSIAFLLSMMMSEMDFLNMRISQLEGGAVQ